jgi:hypothetical protein
MNCDATCFVIMPFGKKPVGDGISCSDADWQPRTFRDTLALLDTGTVALGS